MCDHGQEESTGSSSPGEKLSPWLRRLPPKESLEQKAAYRQIARMRVKRIRWVNPNCIHGVLRNSCGDYFAHHVKSLPLGPLGLIIKSLSHSGINHLEEEKLCIQGVQFCHGANYGDYLQIILARRFGVSTIIKITPSTSCMKTKVLGPEGSPVTNCYPYAGWQEPREG